MLPVILCSATVDLSHPFASTLKLCAVIGCARWVGTSILNVALSIRRVIRANFASCVGILEASGRRQRRPWLVQQSGSRTNQCR